MAVNSGEMVRLMEGERGREGGESAARPRVLQCLPRGIVLNQPKGDEIRGDKAKETRELMLALTPPQISLPKSEICVSACSGAGRC